MTKKWAAVLIIGVIAMFLIAALTAGNARDDTPFTVFSTGEYGASVIYETLGVLGFNATVSRQKIDAQTPPTDVAVIIEPYQEYLDDYGVADVARWVARGGRLILMEDEMSGLEYYMDVAPYYEDDYFAVFEYGMGEAVIGYSSDITNGYLTEDGYAGEFICYMLEEWGGDVSFCEYYHGYGLNVGFWPSLPAAVRAPIYQLALAALVVIWLLGKRFGKPVPLGTQREPQGFIKNMAVIYKNAGKGEVALESLYNDFLRVGAAFFNTSADYARENITELWRQKSLPYQSELLDVRAFVESGAPCDIRRAEGRETLFKAAAIIEKLTDLIKMKY
jgi:hypothetical protein